MTVRVGFKVGKISERGPKFAVKTLLKNHETRKFAVKTPLNKIGHFWAVLGYAVVGPQVRTGPGGEPGGEPGPGPAARTIERVPARPGTSEDG